jgi:carnitine O-acetyltransferase
MTSNFTRHRVTAPAPLLSYRKNQVSWDLPQRSSLSSTSSEIDSLPQGETSMSPYIASHGDYHADALLIEDTKRPLYAEQQNIPRLPVPSLQETIDTFLPTALPFCQDSLERDSLLEAARSFPSQAAHLQERLLRRQKDKSESSWLQEWWNELGYLKIRTSNVIHVSYFFRLPDDPTAHSMTERGAALLQTAAHFAQGIQDGGSRPPDTLPGRNGGPPVPLCSAQYKYLFSSCRIPRPHQDCYQIYPPTTPQHAVVAVRGHFYRIPVTDAKGRLLSRATIESLLCDLVSQSVPENVPELGWLTATNRDRWAETYAIFEATPAISQALEQLQSALCVLCLDVENKMESKDEDSEVALRLWHGKPSSDINLCN